MKNVRGARSAGHAGLATIRRMRDLGCSGESLEMLVQEIGNTSDAIGTKIKEIHR